LDVSLSVGVDIGAGNIFANGTKRTSMGEDREKEQERKHQGYEALQ
jgi:hypothetical protein